MESWSQKRSPKPHPCPLTSQLGKRRAYVLGGLPHHCRAWHRAQQLAMKTEVLI